MGDAIIALVTNKAAREGRRIEFRPEWFDIDSDETPEGVKPDVTRYSARIEIFARTGRLRLRKS